MGRSRRNPDSLWLADAEGQHEGRRSTKGGALELELKQPTPWRSTTTRLVVDVVVVFFNGDSTWFNHIQPLFVEGFQHAFNHHFFYFWMSMDRIK